VIFRQRIPRRAVNMWAAMKLWPQHWLSQPAVTDHRRPFSCCLFVVCKLQYIMFSHIRNMFYILKKNPLPFCSYMLLLDPRFCRSWTARFGGSCAVSSRQQKGVLHLLPALSWSDAKQTHTQTDRHTHIYIMYIYIYIKSCHWHIDMWFSRHVI